MIVGGYLNIVYYCLKILMDDIFMFKKKKSLHFAHRITS